MIDHVSLGVSDLARAIAFYDCVLGALGYQRLWTEETGVGYGPPGATDEPLALFAVGRAARAAGPGCHLAISATSREFVRRFHAEALRLGGTDEGPPGPRPSYGPDYYAAFIRDLDGHKLEAVCHAAE